MWVYFTIAPSSPISLYSRDAMRLAALCFCGTLLALSLCWTTADAGEGVLLGDKGFGPCAATLRPAVLCGQDDSTCPYIFSLPPLTVHLPKLRDLEKIMKDLQKLKDNVDQLRKMCADCKVSQSERVCGRQGEREYEMLIEAKHEHKNERNWMNEKNPERLQENDRDLRQECGMDRVKVEKTMEGDGDADLEKGMTLEENERKKCEAEKESDKGIVKEKSPKDVAEKDRKNQVEGTEGKDKLWKSKVPVASENERPGIREMAVNRNNKETDRDKEKDEKGHSNGEREDNMENRKERKITTNVKNKVKTEESDHNVRRDQTKKTEKKTPTKEDRGRDQIKMSEDHDGHTNREQEQSGEERKKEMEKRIKVERNNEKPKQTESIGRAEKDTTIKEGEMEEDTVKGKEIKTEEEKTVHSVQRDSDGELASSKATERTNFVSISPTPQSIITLTQRPNFMDPDEVLTVTSSLPSPRLSSSTSHFITDVYEESTVLSYGLPTPTTDFWAAGITELPDAESDFGDSRPATTATKIPSAGVSSQGSVSSTTATSSTTTPHQNLNTTTFPGAADHQNIRLNTKTGVKPVAGQKQITSKYDHKPEQAPLPEKKTKDGQKHKPSPQKSTADHTSKPEKESKQVQRPAQNLKNNTIPKHGQNRTTGPSRLPIQKQSSHQKPNPPVQRPPSHQRPTTVNTTSSDKEPESKEITIFNQNSKPVHPFKTNKPEQEQKPDIKSSSKEKTKPDQRSKLNQDLTSVQEPQSGRSQTISHTTKPNQKIVTELKERFDQNLLSEPKSVKDSMSGQKPKSSQKIPQMNQKSKPVQLPKFNRNHTKLVTGQKSKPNVKPKQNQAPQTNKVPRPAQIPNLNSKSVFDQISSTASNKTAKQRPLPRHRPPSRPTLQPGATPAQTPKLTMQPKPSQNAKTHIDPPQISRTITDKIQNSYTDMPPTSPPVKHTAEMSHSPEDTEFSPSTMKTTDENHQIPKHGQDRTTDENLENHQIREHGQNRTTGPSRLPIQKQSSHQKPNPPVQRPPSHQRPTTVNTTSSDKEPESKEITIFNQNSKPVHPFETNKPEQEQTPDIKSRSKEKTKPDQRSKLNQDLTSVQEPQSGRSQTISHTTKADQKIVTELMERFDQNLLSEPKSVKDSMSGQKPKSSQKIPQTNKVPRPTQIPNLHSKSVFDQISSTASNKTAKQRPLPRHRPPSRPTLQPGATPAQTPKLAVQPKPSKKAKTHIDPPQISRTITDKIQNSYTDMPPTSPPVKQTAEIRHSPEDTEFSPSTMRSISLSPKASNSREAAPFPYLYALPKGFTMSPDSRIVSDLRSETPGQPSSIPITSKPNKGIRGILPTVIPSANPGFTKPNPASNDDTTLQTKILQHVEEKAPRKMMTSVPSPSAEPTSTVSSGFMSTIPATSGPEAPAAESSTSSARELRVKIKQVAAFPKNSLSPQRRPSDKHLKEHPEDIQGASTPSTVIPSEVTIARRDCSDLLLLGETKSGVYLVTPDLHSSSFPVFCDMEQSGGGWTVLQRRQDGSVSFNRTWAEYRAGFGELDGGEFWLGNDMIHLLTWNRDMMLFVELEDFDGVMKYAQYDQFRVASERMRYRLTVRGYSGTAGDALRYSRSYDHNNRAFTTPDRDHDRYPSGNCGAYYSSGWWFDACLSANLNGRYYVRSYKGIRDGIFWGTWHNILTQHYPTNDRQAFKTVRMMIRPKGFTP
ncbi:hypothetical protein PAMP_019597 [Pampus punctatissimus]